MKKIAIFTLTLMLAFTGCKKVFKLIGGLGDDAVKHSDDVIKATDDVAEETAKGISKTDIAKDAVDAGSEISDKEEKE